MDKRNEQDTKQHDIERPEYTKPEVITTYSRKELEEKHATCYGLSFVDIFN